MNVLYVTNVQNLLPDSCWILTTVKNSSCIPTTNNGFVAHSMTCPDCMFWDDNKLSCIEVDTSCRVSVSVPTGTPNPECKFNN